MTSTLPPPFRSCCSTLRLRVLSPEGSETASRTHVPLLQLCLSCELHGQCANLETIVTNKKLSAGGRAVDWAWTGQLNSCPQGVLWYKLASCSHNLGLNFEDSRTVVQIWLLLRQHICQSGRTKHILFNSLTWFITFKYWNIYYMGLDYYSCSGP